jgi:hypothetical protein
MEMKVWWVERLENVPLLEDLCVWKEFEMF